MTGITEEVVLFTRHVTGIRCRRERQVIECVVEFTGVAMRLAETASNLTRRESVLSWTLDYPFKMQATFLSQTSVA